MNESAELEKELDKIFEEIFKKMTVPPRELYHYSSIESLKAIVENRKMWASAFECMNDNEEFRSGLNLAEKIFLEFIKDCSFTQSLKESIENNWKEFIESEKKNPAIRPYVLSFSANFNNEHLWENYANQHKGAVLKVKTISGETDSLYGYFLEVIYNQNDWNQKLRNALNSIWKNRSISSKIELDFLFFKSWQIIHIFSPILKAPKWSAEKEWRMIVLGTPTISPQSKYGDIKFRAKDSLIDYLEVDIGKARLDIQSIILGRNFSETSKNSVNIFAKKHDLIVDELATCLKSKC